MLNLYNLIMNNIYLIILFLVLWAILAFVLFLVYNKYIPKPSIKISIISSTIISLIWDITVFLGVWTYLPGNEVTEYLIGNLILTFIMGFALALIMYAIYDYKVAIKIGGLTILIVYLGWILLGFPAL